MKKILSIFSLVLFTNLGAQSVLEGVPYLEKELKEDSLFLSEVPTEEREVVPIITGIYYVTLPDSARVFDEDALGFYYQKVIQDRRVSIGDYDFIVFIEDEPLRLEYVLPSGMRGNLDFEVNDGRKEKIILLANGRIITCPHMDCSIGKIEVE